jgi:aryl-alcohol dehydrogenase-like predicted oxidoreductase
MIRRFTADRPLGRTGFTVTRLGIGDIADRSIDRATLVRTLHRAMDAGLNLIDTAPGYETGYSEEIVGEALRGRRDAMFLIDKIDHFPGHPIAPQIDDSLRRLGHDHVDAFVFHALSTMQQWEAVTQPGGAFDELEACRRAGKLRFVGLSTHDPIVLAAALRSGRCDIAMFPIGPAVDRRYELECLPLARALGVATVCFKTFGAGKLLGDTEGYGMPLRQRPRGKVGSQGTAVTASQLPRLTVEQCLHYTLTMDPDVALLGMSLPNEQDAAFAAAASFAGPLDEETMERTRAAAAEAIAGKGRIHWNPDVTRPH